MTSDSQPQSPSLEEQIALLKQQLAQAQKLTALGELVSTTTHEFNNVLMTIINYAQLGMRHKDEPTRDKAFEKILAAGQRAAKITNSVLGMARNRSNSFEATDLAHIINESLVLLEREMAKYRIKVDTQFSKVPEVWAIGNQIQQVLLNLLINARQAMSGGGSLLIKLEHDPATDMVDLMVRDTGCGIAPEHLPRIFDPYFSTKSGPDESGKGGTGLGLASCRQIVEAHRGRIRVESTVGRGTAFIIKLPVAKTSTDASPAATTPATTTSTAASSVATAPAVPASSATTAAPASAKPAATRASGARTSASKTTPATGGSRGAAPLESSTLHSHLTNSPSARK